MVRSREQETRLANLGDRGESGLFTSMMQTAGLAVSLIFPATVNALAALVIVGLIALVLDVV